MGLHQPWDAFTLPRPVATHRARPRRAVSSSLPKGGAPCPCERRSHPHQRRAPPTRSALDRGHVGLMVELREVSKSLPLTRLGRIRGSARRARAQTSTRASRRIIECSSRLFPFGTYGRVETPELSHDAESVCACLRSRQFQRNHRGASSQRSGRRSPRKSESR